MTGLPAETRITLGTWPTPVEPAPRLATAVGLRPGDLWVKRDDLTGLGAGGGKIRKLEWTIGAALAEGADTLVTTGAPQSNHARLTALMWRAPLNAGRVTLLRADQDQLISLTSIKGRSFPRHGSELGPGPHRSGDIAARRRRTPGSPPYAGCAAGRSR